MASLSSQDAPCHTQGGLGFPGQTFPVHCATEEKGYGVVLQPTAHKGPQLLAHITLTATTLQPNISPTTAASAVLSLVGNCKAKSKEGCKKC